MTRHHVNLSFYVPSGMRCGKCRFLSKGACTIYNMPSPSSGMKVPECIINIDDEVEEPSPKMLAAWSLKEYRKQYKKHVKNGWPDEMAHQMAMEVVKI